MPARHPYFFDLDGVRYTGKRARSLVWRERERLQGREDETEVFGTTNTGQIYFVDTAAAILANKREDVAANLGDPAARRERERAHWTAVLRAMFDELCRLLDAGEPEGEGSEIAELRRKMDRPWHRLEKLGERPNELLY